jgi:hypothetical protein
MSDNARCVGRQHQLLNLSLIHCAKHQGSTGKQLVVVNDGKGQRRTSNRHNQVDSAPRVTFLKVTHDAAFVLFSGKSRKIQIFRKQLDSRRNRGVKNFANILLDSLDRW